MSYPTYPEFGQNAQAHLFILSAKSVDRLKEYAAKILNFIESHSVDLDDLCYTLQIGREPMKERIAIITSSLSQLCTSLKSYLQRDDLSEDNSFSLKGGDPPSVSPSQLESFLTRRDLKALAGVWHQGGAIEWSKLYDAMDPKQKPRRISLPSYPFARERHWLDYRRPEIHPLQKSGKKDGLHPLVHRNMSNLFEQTYQTTLLADDDFVRDHRVNDALVFAGACTIEMAHAACSHALGLEPDTPLAVKHLHWPQPLMVGTEGATTISLNIESQGAEAESSDCLFKITSESESGFLIHCQGVARSPSMESHLMADIPSIRHRLSHPFLSGVDLYKNLGEIGLNYGPTYQCVRQIFRPSIGERHEILAHLDVSQSASNERFMIPPGLLDGVFQVSLALLFPEDEGGFHKAEEIFLPYSVEEITIHRKCIGTCWAWVRFHDDKKNRQNAISLDMSLFDESGHPIITLSGFNLRKAPTVSSMTDQNTKAIGVVPEDLLVCSSSWQPLLEKRQDSTSIQRRILLVMGTGMEPWNPSLFEGYECHKLDLTPATHEIQWGRSYSEFALEIFSFVQGLLRDRLPNPTELTILVFNDAHGVPYSGISGLLKTATIENPNFHGQVVEVDSKLTSEQAFKLLQEVRSLEYQTEVCCIEGRPHYLSWQEMGAPSDWQARSLWRENGVYLITGGVGGLGLLFARAIAESLEKVHIILMGRSPLNDEKHEILKELRSREVDVRYLQGDVTEQKEVQRVLQGIVEEHGHLDGIIHSAGIIKDNFIIKKDREEFRSVLKVKVEGTVNLDEASRHLDLDFVALFSSGSGVSGNLGQCDYSAANAFMDRYAQIRTSFGRNDSKTQWLSINWPLWKEGGMHIDPATVDLMKESLGLVPLETGHGLDAFLLSMQAGVSQSLVMQGDVSRLAAFMGVQRDQERPQLPPHLNHQDGGELLALPSGSDDLRQRTIDYLKKTLSETLKLSDSQIRSHEPMEHYGIDSVSVMQITNHLEKVFGPLSKTLFFDYKTVAELAHYFMEHFSSPLKSLFNPSTSERDPPVRATQKIASKKLKAGKMISPSERAKEVDAEKPLDIAIVGLSGRYPKSYGLDDFWDNLKSGRDCISSIPKSRWDARSYYTKDRTRLGKHFCRKGGFIDDFDCFDPLFFNITPREAEFMDPQERLFLEHVWMALEDAGIRREDLKGTSGGSRTGVYAGVMYGEYQLYGAESSLMGQPMVTSGSYASIANRVSYFLDLHGPSMAIDTMCSSSLTAIHLACQDLTLGQTDVGIAGGVNLSVHPNKYMLLSAGQFISSEGRCASFGSSGDGYVPGEGVGVVLLKRLHDAVRDGDHIYGVIKGSSLNHGGKTNGYSVPNPLAQEQVILRALKQSGLSGDAISYVEAHGTGTQLGDPIEVAALSRSLGRKEGSVRWLGSVKSNIGHCESAAGVGGLTKVLLQMKHRMLVPSLHAESLNPHIDFESSGFKVCQTPRPWESKGHEDLLAAGLSSFGAGGANAHLVIQEYRPTGTTERAHTIQPDAHIIILSARTKEALHSTAQKMLDFVHIEPSLRILDLAYTLQVGREDMEERLALMVHDMDDLKVRLGTFVNHSLGDDQIFTNTVDLYADDTDQDDLEVPEDDAAQFVMQAWLSGQKIAWQKMYRGSDAKRVSLPQYSFARDRYWIQVPEEKRTLASSQLHPFIHRNTSSLDKVRFTTDLSDQMPLIRDHTISGKAVLPAALYLEMVAAGIKRAMRGSGEHQGMHLRHIIWSKPCLIDESSVSVDLELGYHPSSKDLIQFEVRGSETSVMALSVFCQGAVGMIEARTLDAIPVDSIRKRLTQMTDASDCYALFRKAKMDYGPCFQSIEELHWGGGEVLARLTSRLPDELKSEVSVDPSILDGAFQSCLGLAFGSQTGQANHDLGLPFGLDQLEWTSTKEELKWAWIRETSGIEGQAQLRKVDIDLMTLSGTVAIKMRGLSFKSSQKADVLDVSEGLQHSSQRAEPMREGLYDYLWSLFEKVLKIPRDRIRPETPFQRFGFDSIVAMNLIQEMESDFPSLPKTLFFEYQNIGQLSEYFEKHHPETLSRMFAGSVIEPDAAMKQSLVPRAPAEKVIKTVDGPPRSHIPPSSGDIAIVSLSGRFPGADTMEEFWDNLLSGKDSITEIPSDRWPGEKYFDPEKGKPGFTYCRWGGFLKNVKDFDPLFFGMSRHEARVLDPKISLFMETVWNLLEESGYTRDRLRHQFASKVGVFVGAMYQQPKNPDADLVERSATSLTSYSSMANRVSHFFDLQGPSVAVDTMCSSSLVAVHMACKSLRDAECRMAIAGGVNLSLIPEKYIGLSLGQLIASRNESRSFTAGDGYIPAEGVGAVLLKPLDDARRDGDEILACIKSTALNHGGQTFQYAVPNLNSQVELIRENFERAGITPDTISYVESAATGSSMGDAVEINALKKVFGPSHAGMSFPIGSVKSNIGHAEAASGMSQLAKVILQMKHQKIVPSIRVDPLNPEIHFEGSPFYLQKESRPWIKLERVLENGERVELPRRATVSSFGAGGSNAHLILEEYSQPEASLEDLSSLNLPYLFIFSAMSEARLSEHLSRVLEHLRESFHGNLRDLSLTLQMRREEMACRVAFVSRGLADLMEQISAAVGFIHSDQKKPADLLFGMLGSSNETDLPDSESLKQLLIDGRLSSVGHAWTKGADINWEDIWDRLPYRLIKLPTYPFAREQNLALANVPKERSAEPTLKEVLCAVMGLEISELEPYKPLLDYGLDSLSSLSLTREIEQRLKLKMTQSDLSQISTFDDLKKWVKQAPNVEGKEREVRVKSQLEPFPLSERQLGLWAHQMMAPESAAYNVPMAMRYQGQISLYELQVIVDDLTEQYPLLTSTCFDQMGKPHLRPGSFRIEVQSIGQNDVLEGGVTLYLKELSQHPFDLKKDPLCRAYYCAEPPNSCMFLFVFHHLIFDGRSASIFMGELHHRLEGTSTSYRTSFSYGDFVTWEQDFMETEKARLQRNYWMKELDDHVCELMLPENPFGHPETAQSVSLDLTASLSAALRKMIQDMQVTPSIFFLAVFKILLSRYSGQNRQVIAMPTMGRPSSAFDVTMGYFVNLILIQSEVRGDLTLMEFMDELKFKVAEGLDHADYPFTRIATALNEQRGSREPLYQISFAYQNFAMDRGNDNGVPTKPLLSPINGIQQEGEDAIGLEIYDHGDVFRLCMDYLCQYFSEDSAKFVLNHYQNLLEGLLRDPKLTIDEYHMLSSREYLERSKPNSLPFGLSPQDLYPELLGKSLITHADRLAVQLVGDKKPLSYQDLDRRVHQLASFLLEESHEKPCVGVCLKPSQMSLISILAILRLGGTYVPLDHRWPDQRIKDVILDARPSLLLTDQSTSSRLKAIELGGLTCLNVDRNQRRISQRAKELASRSFAGGDLAYIIYTSGSTGKPKGVGITYESMSHHIQVISKQYALKPADKILQFASVGVDVSIEQMLPGLLHGAMIVLKNDQIWSAKDFFAIQSAYGISIVDLPPAYLHQLLSYLVSHESHGGMERLRLVISGGESMKRDTVGLWFKSPLKNRRLLNVYGPTEATISSSVMEIGRDFVQKFQGYTMPIGIPLPGTDFLVLDKNGRPVPDGVRGELHIRGPRLSPGYVNQEAKSSKVFITHHNQKLGRLYRTGDQAALMPDGSGRTLFYGRIDSQMKFNGHRIEAGEIEQQLRNMGAVDDSVVFTHENDLVACLESSLSLSHQDVRAFLSDKVPSGWIPTKSLCLKAFPKTSSGLPDRKAIQSIAMNKAVIGLVPEMKSARKKGLLASVLQLWCEELQQEHLDAHANFFDMGGHSLRAISLISKVNESFGSHLTVSDLMKYPTPSDMAHLLKGERHLSPLLCMHEEGEGLPLVLMHAVDGGPSCYAHLARKLDGARPVYIMQSPDAIGRKPRETIEEMAKDYLDLLESELEGQTVALCGWSMGGLIAYEMRRQLASDERRIRCAELILVDTHMPQDVLNMEEDYKRHLGFSQLTSEERVLLFFATDLLRGDEKALRDLLKMSPLDARDDFLSALAHFVQVEDLSSNFESFVHNYRAMNAYKPEKIKESSLVLFCQEPSKEPLMHAWNQLVSDRVICRGVPRSHHEIMDSEDLISYLRFKPLPQPYDAEAPPFIQDLFKEMRLNPRQRIRDRDLEEKGLKPRKVRRWFKDHFDMTFQAYQKSFLQENQLQS